MDHGKPRRSRSGKLKDAEGKSPLPMVPVGTKQVGLDNIGFSDGDEEIGGENDPQKNKDTEEEVFTDLLNLQSNLSKGVIHGKDIKWLLKAGEPSMQAHLHYILVQETKRWLLKTVIP